MSANRITLQDAAVATGDGAILSTREYGMVTIQIETTGFSGDIFFEGKLDAAANWLNIVGIDAEDMATWTKSKTSLVTDTDTYIYHIPIRGLESFRTRIVRTVGSVSIFAVATHPGF